VFVEITTSLSIWEAKHAGECNTVVVMEVIKWFLVDNEGVSLPTVLN